MFTQDLTYDTGLHGEFKDFSAVELYTVWGTEDSFYKAEITRITRTINPDGTYTCAFDSAVADETILQLTDESSSAKMEQYINELEWTIQNG